MATIRIRRRARAPGEKNSRIATIATILGVFGAIATVALSWTTLVDRFYSGPIDIIVGTTECTRKHLTVVFTNSGRRPVTLTTASLAIRRNGNVVPNNIVLTATPDILGINQSTNVTFAPTSVGIPIELPLSGADRCVLDVTFELKDGRETAARRATCACP